MTEEERIWLAKAMGWRQIDGVWHGKGSTWDSLMFHPLTSADDDYDVLEWARILPTPDPISWYHFIKALGEDYVLGMYQVGDYAKAAIAAKKHRQSATELGALGSP